MAHLSCKLNAHIGTGCDYLSKIGTKLGALNAIPEKFLIDFSIGQTFDERQIEACERYLVNVLKNNASEANFDELRCSQYRKNDSVFDLPPTSHSIVKGHIPRWHYIVKKLSNLLNLEYEWPDPVDHGWKCENAELLPEKHLFLIPKNLFVTCNCKVANINQRCRNRCACKKLRSSCTEYCGCENDCSNKTTS